MMNHDMRCSDSGSDQLGESLRIYRAKTCQPTISVMAIMPIPAI